MPTVTISFQLNLRSRIPNVNQIAQAATTETKTVNTKADKQTHCLSKTAAVQNQSTVAPPKGSDTSPSPSPKKVAKKPLLLIQNDHLLLEMGVHTSVLRSKYEKNEIDKNPIDVWTAVTLRRGRNLTIQ